MAARRDALRSRLPALASMLGQRYGATRIVLFGSLAWGEFHARSDVDAAVEGIAKDRIDAAMADAADAVGGLVELFRLEALPASFRERVLREGEPLP